MLCLTVKLITLVIYSSYTQGDGPPQVLSQGENVSQSFIICCLSVFLYVYECGVYVNIVIFGQRPFLFMDSV